MNDMKDDTPYTLFFVFFGLYKDRLFFIFFVLQYFLHTNKNERSRKQDK